MTTRTATTVLHHLLAASLLGALVYGCSSSEDPSSLLASDPSASQDPLKGGNCDKSQSQHCTGREAGADDDAEAQNDDGDAAAAPSTHDAGSTTTTDAGSATHDAAASGTDAGSSPPPPPPPTCTSFTYSAWSACMSNNTQTRTVISSSPSGCTGGTPVLTQSCTYIDGEALYTQYCSNCHGNSKKGSSPSNIQNAINNNTGGMGSLSFLTPAQIQAISTAP